MASYRSSDAACAPPESQKAAADDVYVVALDYECPDRDLCRPDQYLDFQHKFDWKKRTLLQIYKHNEPWQWTPNDLERINLMKDYTKIKEADVWGMPEMVKSMPPFKAIVFKYPWTGADVEEAGLGKDNLEKAMRMLPQSITVVDFGDWVLTPGVAFQRFLTSRIVSNTVTFLALKGISLDLFDKLRRVQFSLVTKVLTIAMLPCDYEIREYLHVIPNRIRFDGKNSTAYYAELGDSVKIRAYADQEPCRTVYLVEPALVALHSRRQLLHINTLDLTKDLGFVYRTVYPA
ncbi:hypothetical protein AAVH_17221 [Aphelenchoides avenae]|nr:hypothetical protein AAVH_17221 [Aphelenchus avenae]